MALANPYYDRPVYNDYENTYNGGQVNQYGDDVEPRFWPAAVATAAFIAASFPIPSGEIDISGKSIDGQYYPPD